jgi:lysophospholipase
MNVKKFDRRTLPPGSTMSVVEATDDWPLRCFNWISDVTPPRGSILFQGGRGDIIEKYIESFDHWNRQGWNVTSFDWRGQGGSGRVLPNPHVGHISDFAVWVDDLATFVAAWRASTPGPHVIMGHSMGGHLLLRALIEQRIEADAIVLVAPMLGFDTAPLSFAAARKLAGFMARIGAPERPAWKSNERPSLPGTSRQKYLTTDVERYRDELWWKGANPALTLGPPSWHWMVQAYGSTAMTEEPGKLEAITIPVLLLGTDGDKLVSPAAIRRFAARIPGARLKMFSREVAHEILRERDGPRDEALATIDAFLAGSAPPH